jgi:hypothetical protein
VKIGKALKKAFDKTVNKAIRFAKDYLVYYALIILKILVILML